MRWEEMTKVATRKKAKEANKKKSAAKKRSRIVSLSKS
jgi:hypothetical protein